MGFESAIAEANAMSHANRPYYRVLLSHDTPVFVVAQLVPRDEYDIADWRLLGDRFYNEAPDWDAESRAAAEAAIANILIPPALRTEEGLAFYRRLFT